MRWVPIILIFQYVVDLLAHVPILGKLEVTLDLIMYTIL